MILQHSVGNLIKLQQFNAHYAYHSLITTDYAEVDNLECGKVCCVDDDKQCPLCYVKKSVTDN